MDEIWRTVYRRWVPALGLLGAGVAGIGAFWQAVGVTLSGALMASLATMISTVRQAEFRDRLEEANKKLLVNAEEIAHLVTGGDSFVYFAFIKGINGAGIVVNNGKYPLYDIQLRMIDLSKSFNGFEGLGANLLIGNLSFSSSQMVSSPICYPINRDDLNINMFFNARNGFWAQLMRCRKVNDEWSHATRVVRNFPNGEQVILYEHIDEGYPTLPADIEWK